MNFQYSKVLCATIMNNFSNIQKQELVDFYKIMNTIFVTKNYNSKQFSSLSYNWHNMHEYDSFHFITFNGLKYFVASSSRFSVILSIVKSYLLFTESHIRVCAIFLAKDTRNLSKALNLAISETLQAAE